MATKWRHKQSLAECRDCKYHGVREHESTLSVVHECDHLGVGKEEGSEGATELKFTRDTEFIECPFYKSPGI